MAEESSPSLGEQAIDVAKRVTEGVKAATSSMSEAISEGKKPGRPLDTLAKMTREAPLGMLLAAFLVGRALASRRRW
jgi:hypothetical protein